MTKPEREYIERRLAYALGPGYVIDSSNGGYRIETEDGSRTVSPRLTGMGIKLFVDGMAATKDEQSRNVNTSVTDL